MRKQAIYIVFFLVIISLPAFVINQGLNPETLRSYINSFGILAPVAYILLATLSNVFPPIGVAPFWFLGVFLFGPLGGFTLSLISNILGSAITFQISRKLGKQIVLKLAGDKTLKTAERIPHLSNPQVLFLAKLFGGALVDYISYVAGFTKIKFLPYLVASTLAVLPMMVLGFFIISQVSFDSPVSTVTGIGVFYLLNYLSSLLLIPLFYILVSKSKGIKTKTHSE